MTEIAFGSPLSVIRRRLLVTHSSLKSVEDDCDTRLSR